MSRLTDIKQRILQLEAGAFQELCDAYLSKFGYKNIVSLGMKAGTQKTTKGIPDTYFVMDDGKYVFVMYTTQQSQLIDKIQEDITDCLNSQKTKISVHDISEIVYCHTSDNISAGDDKRLKEICLSKEVALRLFGVDTIASDIYNLYHGIARDFLNISISTDQIFSYDEFLASHDSNSLVAPLATSFQHRIKEVQDVLASIENNTVTIICGNAGVGKTRLALECCKMYAEQNECRLFCIRSKNLPLYDDLKVILDAPHQFLLLIDDANQISNFEGILQYLLVDSRLNIKVLITVRDYARQAVIEKARVFSIPSIIKLAILADKEIEELLDKNLGIKNPQFLKKIANIALGNARLAIMAGKIAVEKQSLDSINDSSELYESYYDNHTKLNIISTSKNARISAGIVAFFAVINLEKADELIRIITNLGYSFDEFVDSLYCLHEQELVDIYKDKIVRISDQCFANYILFRVFIKERLIPYSNMIKECFGRYTQNCIDTTNIIINIFSTQDVRDYIKNQVDDLWKYFEEKDELLFFEFFKVFHAVKPTETLFILKKLILEVEQEDYDISLIDFKKEERNNQVTDDILKIIGSYSNSTDLATALDLFFAYLQKKPRLFMEFYHAISRYFSIDQDSFRFNYYAQEHLANRFILHGADWQNEVVTSLFIYVSELLLKLHFMPAEAGRGRSVTFYKVPIVLTEGSKEYRKLIWNNLYKIYEDDKYKSRIEELVKNYGIHFGDEVKNDVVAFDIQFITRFFQGVFSDKNPLHCRIVDTIIMRVRKYFNVQIDKADYANYFGNQDYLVYSLIGQDYFDAGDYEEGRRIKENNIKKMLDSNPRAVICQIFDVLKIFEKVSHHSIWRLQEGLGFVFNQLFAKPKDFIFAVEKYLECDTPIYYYSDRILEQLFATVGDSRTQEIITKYSYRQQNTWHFLFFKNMPANYINDQYVEEFYKYLQFDEGGLTQSPIRDLSFLDKYLSFDEEVYIKASRIIYERHKDSRFLFTLYFEEILNHYVVQPEKVIQRYQGDFGLLKNIYFTLISYDSHDDQGEFLLTLINTEPSIIDDYIKITIESKMNYGEFDRLSSIWFSDDYMKIADQVFTGYYNHSNINEWQKPYFIQNMFKCRKLESDVLERQENWIKHIIDEKYNDNDVIKILFRCITHLPSELRRKFIMNLLHVNKDPQLFAELSLEEDSWSGWGSMIPMMEERIKFLESLLPSLSGLLYLEHKNKVESDIKKWKWRIEQEQIDEIMRTCE